MKKGYNKELKSFIEYVFKKYAKNEKVQEFKAVYEDREQKRAERKATPKPKQNDCIKVSIKKETAEICEKLVDLEIKKYDLMGTNDLDYRNSLSGAWIDLITQCSIVLKKENQNGT